PPISRSEQKVSERCSTVSKLSMREMYRMQAGRARPIRGNQGQSRPEAERSLIFLPERKEERRCAVSKNYANCAAGKGYKVRSRYMR
ncbi:MAG: hypothetical protein D3914_15860, partial [Candidatus Electrothrix sp. LOE2]|nr:hypothetical protein [Candidatus Electrothrix sp. LOE2]